MDTEVGHVHVIGSHLLESHILVIPADMQVHQLLLIAAPSDATSWCQGVKLVRSRLGGIPCILEWLGYEVTTDMRNDAKARKRLLRSYRLQVVYPGLQQYDH